MATRSTKTTAKAKTTAAKPAKAPAKTTAKIPAKTAAKPPAAKIAPTAAVAAPKPTIVGDVTPVVADAPLKKPELVERVMAESGMKKKDVKPVVEAMLKVIGQSLAEGEELTVPPLGKVMIKRVKDVAKAKIITLKVRHPKNDTPPPKDPLAQAAE